MISWECICITSYYTW